MANPAIRRKRLVAVGAFTLWGLVLGTFVGGLTQQIDGGRLLPPLIRGAANGVVIGALIGIGEELVFGGFARGLGYLALNVSRVIAYAAVTLGSILSVNAAYISVAQGVSFGEAASVYLGFGSLGRDLVFAVLAAVGGASLLEVRRLHNPGDLRRFLLGRYRHPEEEERVFLFADLVDSTTLAERLGNLAYSELIRDCYFDMAEAILAWRGQVYQYVGDEVVVTWPLEDGLRDARCVRCFFDMAQLLAARRDRYEARFGVVPTFRAGIHGGTVVTTWVGEAKKELAHHGDALNVAARLQGACRELDAVCLISADVHDRLELPAGLQAVSQGIVPLKGRTGDVEVWSVARAPYARPNT